MTIRYLVKCDGECFFLTRLRNNNLKLILKLYSTTTVIILIASLSLALVGLPYIAISQTTYASIINYQSLMLDVKVDTSSRAYGVRVFGETVPKTIVCTTDISRPVQCLGGIRCCPGPSDLPHNTNIK